MRSTYSSSTARAMKSTFICLHRQWANNQLDSKSSDSSLCSVCHSLNKMENYLLSYYKPRAVSQCTNDTRVYSAPILILFHSRSNSTHIENIFLISVCTNLSLYFLLLACNIYIKSIAQFELKANLQYFSMYVCSLQIYMKNFPIEKGISVVIVILSH